MRLQLIAEEVIGQFITTQRRAQRKTSLNQNSRTTNREVKGTTQVRTHQALKIEPFQEQGR